MDTGGSQYFFKETRLNLEPPSAASVVSIRVPSPNSSRSVRRRITRDGSGEEELAFRLQNLATHAGVYYRRWHDIPRGFLWRVLDDGLLLSLRAVDLCKRDMTLDANLVLEFRFSTPIHPACVALSDPKEHDALCVFVLDEAGQFYTFTLRPDHFRKKSAVDAGLSDLAKVESPAGLGFKYAHRMVAVSTTTVLVTVNDGGMIRLDRVKSDDGSTSRWKETFFNVQGWAQNLRSLLPFQGNHTVKYGKVSMEYSAATAVEVTNFGLDDALFAITICLDHRMRVWNLADGQVLHTRDILDTERLPQEIGKWAIDPSQSNLIQATGRSRGQRIVATFSPIGAGQFKFWKVSAADATVNADDLFPRLSLVPKPPSSSDVWTLADFKLASPAENVIHLWILWKNNMTYRVQRLELDRQNMQQSWATGWDNVYADNAYEAPTASGPCDSVDVSEKWLERILQPGRFSKATLETALRIYERTLGVTTDTSKGAGLAESICSVLGSTATLQRRSDDEMDYDQFRSLSESQWRRFHRLVIEFDKQRGEALGLAVDPQAGLTWTVCADVLSAIRECSPLERLYHSMVLMEEELEAQRDLVSTALTFVDGFSNSFLQLSNSVLRSELYEEPSKTDLERLQYFSDKAGFWRGITDEDCAQVTEVLGSEFTAVTDEVYGDVLELFSAPAESQSQKIQLPLTQFGRKLTMATTQEALAIQWKVAFSQLILLVHMEFEFDSEEDALHQRVDVGRVYKRLIGILRRLDLMRRLASTEIPVPAGDDRDSSKKMHDDTQTVTTLEASVGHLLGFSANSAGSLALGLTDLVSNLCAPDSDIEISPPHVQCSLLKRGRADLAFDMSAFCDQEPFSVYVNGRVLLAMKDFDNAAWLFKGAAIGMSNKSVRIDRHSSGLLDDTEWNLINCGQGRYYSHITSLYEKARAYAHVIEFARLAVQFLSFEEHAERTMTDMQTRLFSASVASSQWEMAHTSLQHFQNHALRQASLRKLVTTMCESGDNMALVELSFPGMQQEVEELLAEWCAATRDVLRTTYHQVLYSWRIKRSNFRGAAAVLLDRIHKLKLAGEGDKLTGDDILDTPVTRQYLLLINALSCVDPKQAWIFDEGSVMNTQRRVVSLQDVRKQYQDEMDRITAIQNNQFGFGADDVMEMA